MDLRDRTQLPEHEYFIGQFIDEHKVDTHRRRFDKKQAHKDIIHIAACKEVKQVLANASHSLHKVGKYTVNQKFEPYDHMGLIDSACIGANKRKYSELETDIEQKTQTIATLRKRIEQFEQLQSTLAQSRQNIQTKINNATNAWKECINQQQKEYELKMNELNQKHGLEMKEIEMKHAKQMQSSHYQIKQWQIAYSSLKNGFDALKNEQRASNKLMHEIRRLREKQSMAIQQRQEYQMKVKKANQTIMNLQREMQALRNDIDQKEILLIDSKTRLSTIQSKLQKFEKQDRNERSKRSKKRKFERLSMNSNVSDNNINGISSNNDDIGKIPPPKRRKLSM